MKSKMVNLMVAFTAAVQQMLLKANTDRLSLCKQK